MKKVKIQYLNVFGQIIVNKYIDEKDLERAKEELPLNIDHESAVGIYVDTEEEAEGFHYWHWERKTWPEIQLNKETKSGVS
jgi:hypothetical protein